MLSRHKKEKGHIKVIWALSPREKSNDEEQCAQLLF